MNSPNFSKYLEEYHSEGFFIAADLLPKSTCEQILARAMSLVDGSQLPQRLMNPHRTDSQFLRLLQDQRIVEIIEHVFSEEAVGVQTMFYIKPPRSTGHSWHQDQYYIPGAPKPIAAVWCALDSTDKTNGALVVYPGSHKYGLQEMVALDSPDFANHSKTIEPDSRYSPRFVCMEPGDVLFFDGLLIHGSYPNYSETRLRRAFISHYLARGSAGAHDEHRLINLRSGALDAPCGHQR